MREEKAVLNEVYEFAGFHLNTTEKTLSKNGEPLPLTPKAFETLLVLIENRGKILSKEELMSQIWKDSFVDENNLAFNIKTLRRTFGDEANNPKIIETIPRRGYRFIAQVKENSTHDNLSSKSLEPQKSGGKKYLTAAFTILFLASFVLGAWIVKDKFLYPESKFPVLSRNFEVEKLTTSGNSRLAVISPNGKYMLYTNILEGKNSLWIQEIEKGNNVQLIAPSEEGYTGGRFSNSGDSIFFVKQSNNVPTIYRISVHGGIATKIADQSEGWIGLSPDDKQISFVRYNKSDNNSCALMIADTDGKNERKLAEVNTPFAFWVNDWSPDGKTIAVASGNSENGGKDISLNEIDVETGKERPITPQKFFVIKDIQWLPDNYELLVTGSLKFGDKHSIFKISRTTGEVTQLTKDSSGYLSLSLNKDADKLISTHVESDFHLYFGSIKDSNFQKRFVKAEGSFVFTKDNKIIYSSDSGGNSDIWSINSDGSDQKQLTVENSVDFAPVLSNDQRFIYFTSNRTGEHQVWRMNLDGSNLLQITKNEGGYPLYATQDGNYLYYQNSKTKQIWKTSLSSGEESLYSEKLGYFNAFSPDGKNLAYLHRDKETKEVKISIIDTETKDLLKTFPMAEKNLTAYNLRWTNDGKSLTYITFSKNSKDLGWRQNLNEEKPSLISKLGDEVSDFSLSPDNENFAHISGTWKHDAVLIKGLK